MLDLATSADNRALDNADVVLDLAHVHGFTLITIDALELIAELATRRNNHLLATQLLTASAHERRRIGYMADMRPTAGAASASSHVSSPADDAPLTLTQAVELARRARGERGRPTHGWDSLTPTELEVVLLVTAGYPNANIADRLRMSTPTVKTHLTHIFTKLDVSNRTELANVAHDHQTTQSGHTTRGRPT